MYIIGRKVRGKIQYLAKGGRTKFIDKATLFEPDQDGYDLALLARELPGDHLIRVYHDSDRVRHVMPQH